MATKTKKGVESRKEIYALFEQLVGRTMTTEEHEKLKEGMLEYVSIRTNSLLTNSQAMEKRLQFLNERWVQFLNKRKTPQEIIEEFNKLFVMSK